MTENVYGTPNPDSPLPGQHDLDGAAAMQAALADSRDRTGTAPGEGERPTDERQQYGSLSSLDRLKKEAAKDITNYREFPIPGDYRPGWSFVVDCMISGDQLERYTNQSKRRVQGKEDINASQLNARVLVNHVTEIRENGETLRDEAGKPIKLSSREFLDAMGKTTAITALQTFVWDSHIGAIVDRVMDAAGYSREGDNWVEGHRVDPTHG